MRKRREKKKHLQRRNNEIKGTAGREEEGERSKAKEGKERGIIQQLRKIE